MKRSANLARRSGRDLAFVAFLAFGALVGCATAQPASGPQAAAPQDLYVLSVKNGQLPDGKAFDMRLREIERLPESSLVEVDLDAGEDPAAWVPMLRGLCGLMHARQQASAVGEQLSVHPLRFRLSFSGAGKVDDKPGPPRLVLGAKECATIER